MNNFCYKDYIDKISFLSLQDYLNPSKKKIKEFKKTNLKK